MIELFSANTPNGKKISIMLEEIGYEYKVIKIDLDKGEQFKSNFIYPLEDNIYVMTVDPYQLGNVTIVVRSPICLGKRK
mgnify:CR=1 FL=1